MSRSEELYPFVNTDSEEIDEDVASIYTAVTGKEAAYGIDKMFCQILSSLVLYMAANTNYAANQNLASRATGENLDALGELYYEQDRPEATYAWVTVEFTISQAQSTAILIPAGTRVTNADSTIFFTTDEDVYIPIGSTTAGVHCACTELGTIGNGIAAGDICVCVDTFPYYDSCESTDESGGGSDEPDDDEYYDLLVQSQDAYSAGGSEGAYIYFAKHASSEIQDVIVNTPTDGTVKIYCLMNNGTIAGSEVKAKVLAACDDKTRRPMTDKVVVSDADYKTYTVNMTYYLQNGTGASAASMEAAITKAVDEYVAWQCGKLGRDIIPDELISRVRAAGARRVVITTPVYTVLRDGIITQDTDISQGEDVPELAKCTSITLTNGGYEDE